MGGKKALRDKRMIKTDKIREILIIGIFFILTAVLLGVLFLRGDRSGTEYLNFDEYDMLHVQDQMTVEQMIRPTEDFLISVSLFCANIEPDMGSLEIEIADEDGKRIYRREVEADALETGTFNRFAVNKAVEKNRDYTLSLTFRLQEGADEELSLGIMAVPESKNLPQTGECQFDGIKDDYNLAVTYEMGRPPLIGLTLFLAVLVIVNLFLFPDVVRMKKIQKLKDCILHFVLHRKEKMEDTSKGQNVYETSTKEEKDEKNQYNDSLL